MGTAYLNGNQVLIPKWQDHRDLIERASIYTKNLDKVHY